MAILEVHELTKWFGPLAAVRGVDISLGKAEILGMIGPNGAGKTTLFNVIAGVHKPTSGKVLLEGKVISGLPPHRICKRGVAKTSHMAGPFPGLSVLENVLVGALHGGQLKMKPALERAEEVLELVGLADRRRESAAALSVPERRRLDLARTLATGAKVVLLDENMAGLNAREIDMALGLLLRVRQTGQGNDRRGAHNEGRNGHFRPGGGAAPRGEDSRRASKGGSRQRARHRGIPRQKGVAGQHSNEYTIPRGI